MEKITYGYYQSPFGEMVIAQSQKGLCWLGFMVDGYKGNGYERMRAHFSDAELVQDNQKVRVMGDKIITAWEQGNEADFPIDMHGTSFQKSVWAALLHIKKGHLKSYGEIANDIGSPNAARAVGSAVGSNPVSLIVPCHRVVQKSGAIGNYGWGVDIKRQILTAESVEI